MKVKFKKYLVYFSLGFFSILTLISTFVVIASLVKIIKTDPDIVTLIVSILLFLFIGGVSIFVCSELWEYKKRYIK